MSITRWLPLAGIVALTGLTGCQNPNDVCSRQTEFQLTGLENDNDETGPPWRAPACVLHPVWRRSVLL